MHIYSIHRTLGTTDLTLKGPGDLVAGVPFASVRLASEHAHAHNRANGDGEATIHLFTHDMFLEDHRPIPREKNVTVHTPYKTTWF